jgi:hypothetical protein
MFTKTWVEKEDQWYIVDSAGIVIAKAYTSDHADLIVRALNK